MAYPTHPKTLDFFSDDQSTNQEIIRMVRRLVGDELRLTGHTMEDRFYAPFEADLVVTSGPWTYDAAKKLYPNSPVLVGERVVTGDSIEELLSVPEGSRALVVSTSVDSSEDIIKSLEKMGITHLKYESYKPSLQIAENQYDLAITPHLMHRVPKEIKRQIDIGGRALSVKTFSQILSFFGLDIKYLDMLETAYVRRHLDACRRVQEALNTSNRFRRLQEFIIQEIDEGVVSFDSSGDVMIQNSAIRDIFGEYPNPKSSPDFRRIISRFDLQPPQDGQQALVDHSLGSDLYCTKAIFRNGKETQYFYTFRPVAQIQNLAQKVRKEFDRSAFKAKYTFSNITGEHPAIRLMKHRAEQFAKTDQSILITGESGTGKELLAQSIHNASLRADRPFVAANFGAISPNLLESELFGYLDGAFTGARKGGKKGYFELANDGTIFLDEIGDAPLHTQVNLLRVLEEREVSRLGSESTIPLNVRFIAATNRNLAEMIEQGSFREDLFFRLNVLPIQTVPLRKMKDHILPFAKGQMESRFGNAKPFSAPAADLLRDYRWPGNFRELRNAVDYMMYASSDHASIEISDIPEYILHSGQTSPKAEELAAPMSSLFSPDIEWEEEPLQFPILALLAGAFPSGIGRGALTRLLVQNNIPAKEASVRRALGFLEKKGLIRVGNTRQGSCITQEGFALLKAKKQPL